MKILYIGRFQPFHKGHSSVIEKLAEDYGIESIIVAIGSSNIDHDSDNPFTFEERKQMLLSEFPDLQIEQVPDYPDDEEWISRVKALGAEKVCTGSTWVKQVLEAHKIEAIKPEFLKIDDEIVSGTKIRERILQGRKWKHLVPEGSREVLEKINGAARIRKVAEVERKDWFHKKTNF